MFPARFPLLWFVFVWQILWLSVSPFREYLADGKQLTSEDLIAVSCCLFSVVLLDYVCVFNCNIICLSFYCTVAVLTRTDLRCSLGAARWHISRFDSFWAYFFIKFQFCFLLIEYHLDIRYSMRNCFCFFSVEGKKSLN